MGNAAEVKAILKTNAAAVLLTNPLGEMPLHVAATAAVSPEIVEALLAAKAPVNAAVEGNAALHIAIFYSWSTRYLEALRRTAGEDQLKEFLTRGMELTFSPFPRNVGNSMQAMDLPVLRQAVNATNDPARTRRELQLVDMLLAAGADPSLANLGGFTPLLFAAKADNRDVVKLLLDHGAMAEVISNDGETPLHAAICLGDQQLAGLLLDQGHAAINGTAGLLAETGLHAAASRGDTAMVQWLLDRQADVKVVDKAGYTPLLNAAEKGNREIIDLLGQHGADFTVRNQSKSSAFILAAGTTNRSLVEWLASKPPLPAQEDKILALQTASIYGRLAIVKWLLDSGVSASISNQVGTPLHAAAGGPRSLAHEAMNKTPGDDWSRPPPASVNTGSEEEYVQILSLLLAGGAEVNALGTENRTPLHYATTFSFLPGTEILLQHQADVMARTKVGKTPLHQAAAFGSERLVILLLDHGAKLEAEDQYYFTPLRDAASTGNLETVQTLLARGAKVGARDRYRATPLHWAAMSTNAATVGALLDGGAEVNALDQNRRTALHQAAFQGREAIVKLLLSRQAKVNLADGAGDTPLDLAKQAHFPAVVEILLRASLE